MLDTGHWILDGRFLSGIQHRALRQAQGPELCRGASSIQHRCAGGIIGSAIGDAFGAPYECMDYRDIRRFFGDARSFADQWKHFEDPVENPDGDPVVRLTVCTGSSASRTCATTFTRSPNASGSPPCDSARWEW
jgi:hypothetical protein